MSIGIIERMEGYYNRSVQLAPYLRPSIFAPLFFATRHFMPRILFRGEYGGRTFYARNLDYSAIREIFFEKDYEYLAPLLKERSSLSVLDVGAHIGIFSLWMLSLNPNLKIVSVEASPETYALLSRTVKSAVERTSATWKSIHRAAWKNNDMISFTDSGDAMSHQINEKGREKVQGITLADLICQFEGKKIDLMKVDIEGAEESFLCEHPELLRDVDRLIVELHAKYCNTKKVTEVLEGTYPYISEVQGRSSKKVVLYCRQRPDE